MGAVPVRVLFISRAFPPVLGGIEKHNFEIHRALSAIADVELIANRHGKRFLPFFLPYAFMVALTKIHRCDVVLLGDGVLAVLGFLLRRLCKKPVVCVVHGLDVTYRHPLYQRFWLHRFLPDLDQYIAVGNETIRQGVTRGLDAGKFVFVGNGVDSDAVLSLPVAAPISDIVGQPLAGPVLLTLGRLVRRKGVEWFVREVMPLLPNHLVYVVAGDGVERPAIEAAVKATGLQGRVVMLGQVSETQKQGLLCGADVFVQPNIRVPGDMEGFGLVVLEAAAAGCPVVASRLEGLQDAIHDGRNGILVEPEDPQAYARVLRQLLENPAALVAQGQAGASYVREHFSWAAVAGHYLRVLRSVCSGSGPSC